MAPVSSRRAFLSGRLSGPPRTQPLPPGAERERFLAACTRCTACAEACPEAIIVADARGWPMVDFARGACTFCAACAEACPNGALVPERLGAWPWRAQVSSACLALNRVSCRSCQDFCDAGAIHFRLETGGRARPEIDLEACTGCGACAGACPAGAIGFFEHHPADDQHPAVMEVAP